MERARREGKKYCGIKKGAKTETGNLGGVAPRGVLKPAGSGETVGSCK